MPIVTTFNIYDEGFVLFLFFSFFWRCYLLWVWDDGIELCCVVLFILFVIVFFVLLVSLHHLFFVVVVVDRCL